MPKTINRALACTSAFLGHCGPSLATHLKSANSRITIYDET